jgi:hypothetical protein
MDGTQSSLKRLLIHENVLSSKRERDSTICRIISLGSRATQALPPCKVILISENTKGTGVSLYPWWDRKGPEINLDALPSPPRDSFHAAEFQGHPVCFSNLPDESWPMPRSTGCTDAECMVYIWTVASSVRHPDQSVWIDCVTARLDISFSTRVSNYPELHC